MRTIMSNNITKEQLKQLLIQSIDNINIEQFNAAHTSALSVTDYLGVDPVVVACVSLIAVTDAELVKSDCTLFSQEYMNAVDVVYNKHI